MSEYSSSPNPVDQVEADPSKPWKAVVPTVLSVCGLFAAVWIADEDPFTAKEATAAFFGALIGAGVIGGATYSTKNPLRRKQ